MLTSWPPWALTVSSCSAQRLKQLQRSWLPITWTQEVQLLRLSPTSCFSMLSRGPILGMGILQKPELGKGVVGRRVAKWPSKQLNMVSEKYRQCQMAL